MLFSHRYKQTLEINETKFEMKTYTNEGDGTCLFIQTNDAIIYSRRCKYTCDVMQHGTLQDTLWRYDLCEHTNSYISFGQ